MAIPSLQNNNSEEEYYKIVKPLRTYEMDLAEFVRQTSASKTEVNLKEQTRKREREKEARVESSANPPKERSGNRPIIFLVVFILVFVSLGSGFFLWFYRDESQNFEEVPTETPEQVEFETLVKGNSQKLVEIETRDREDLAKALENAFSQEKVNSGEIIVFRLVDKISGQNFPLQPRTFLQRIESEAPPFLSRALGEKMDFGLISFEKFSAFAVFEVKDFNNTFAGMLSWEKNMSPDLFGWISEEVSISQFSDLTSSGKDLRVLRNPQGEIILLYSFLDKNTLLITDKLSTFREILNIF